MKDITILESFRTTLEDVLKSTDYWGIRGYSEKTQFRMARNGYIADNKTILDKGVMVEVISEGQIGYAGTNNLSKEGIKKAATSALFMAKISKINPLCDFDISVRPKAVGSYKSTFKRPISELDPALVGERLIKTSKGLKDAKDVIEAGAYAMITETDISYLSSHGTSWQQNFQIVTNDMYATCLLYTSPSPRDVEESRMPSSA